MKHSGRAKRTLFAVVLCSIACLSTALTRASAQSSSAVAASSSAGDNLPQGVVIGTGAPVGVYFAVGNALCRLVQRDVTIGGENPESKLRCGVAATGGSVPNVEGMRTGAFEFGIVQSDWIFHAYRGSSRFAGRRIEKLRALFSLHTEPFQLLAARNLSIAGLADLKGRKVNIGPKGTAQNEIMTELFRLHKLENAAFAQVLELSPLEQFQAFCAGDVEAFGMLIGAPNASYAAAMQNCGGEMVDVSSELIRGLVAAVPYYALATISPTAYPASGKATATFGVLAVSVTTSDTSIDTAYQFVRAVFERLDELKAMHPSLAELDPARMIRDGITVPLHPGAEKYYRERGWIGRN